MRRYGRRPTPIHPANEAGTARRFPGRGRTRAGAECAQRCVPATLRPLLDHRDGIARSDGTWGKHAGIETAHPPSGRTGIERLHALVINFVLEGVAVHVERAAGA